MSKGSLSSPISPFFQAFSPSLPGARRTLCAHRLGAFLHALLPEPASAPHGVDHAVGRGVVNPAGGQAFPKTDSVYLTNISWPYSARSVHPSIAGHEPHPGVGPMMVSERAGLFCGSRVQARMGFARLGTRIHLTFGNRCSLGGRRHRPAFATAGWKATPSLRTL